MLYLGIDQHKRQLTVNLRSEDGTVESQRGGSRNGDAASIGRVGYLMIECLSC